MSVYVYNENGSFMFSKVGTLIGFTSNTVTVQYGNITYVYGERGEFKFSK